jgi:hypothetical protein
VRSRFATSLYQNELWLNLDHVQPGAPPAPDSERELNQPSRAQAAHLFAPSPDVTEDLRSLPSGTGRADTREIWRADNTHSASANDSLTTSVDDIAMTLNHGA